MSDKPGSLGPERDNNTLKAASHSKLRIALVAFAVVGMAGLLFMLADGSLRNKTSDKAAEHSDPTAVTTESKTNDDNPSEPIALDDVDLTVRAGLVVDVFHPERVLSAVRDNTWLGEAAATPLFEGFLGSWRGFLNTSGKDVHATFTGTVADLFASSVLTSPFRLVWMSGSKATKSPVLLLSNPQNAALTSYQLLRGVAQRGAYVAKACPTPRLEGASASVEHKTSADNTSKVNIVRLLLADHAIYASQTERGLLFAQRPDALYQALCSTLPEPSPTRDNVDIELSLVSDNLGRGQQVLTRFLNLDNVPSLTFQIDKNRLVPVGIQSKLGKNAHLKNIPLSNDLLRLIPESSSMLLTFNVELPASMHVQDLKDHLRNKYQGDFQTRQCALIWNPHGTRGAANEVALIWNSPQDAIVLAQIFSGGNAMQQREICGHLVMASQDSMFTRMQASCEGKVPSMLNAAPSIVSGLKSNMSIGFGIHLGSLLSTISMDAYWAEQNVVTKVKTPPPQELLDAKQTIEALPYFLFLGTEHKGELQPGGYRS